MRHSFSRSLMFAALALLWLPVVAYCWNATYRYERGRLKPAGKADYELLKPADVVIVEENIGILPATNLAAYHPFISTGQPPADRARQ